MNLDEEEYAPAGLVPAPAHLLMIEHNEALCVAIEGLRGELRDLRAAAVQNRAARQVLKNANKRQRVVIDDLRERLAEFERTRSTGGPAPAETRDWGNEQHVPPPESASRRDMDPPARYGASNQTRSKP